MSFLGGPFSHHHSNRFDDIKDGLSSTLLMAEVLTVAEFPSQASGQWGSPISDFSTSLGGQTFEGWLTPNSPLPDDVARMCPPVEALRPGCKCNLIGNDTTLQSFAARSRHPQGVNAALCDGSIRFFSETIDQAMWRAFSTSSGHEVIGGDQ